MVREAVSVFGYICGAVGIDWIFATRIGSYFSDFDYRYWPLSRLRWIGLAALISAALYMWKTTGSNGPLSSVIPFAVLIMAYAAAVLADASAQRRAAHKKPPAPRYSDGEYGS